MSTTTDVRPNGTPSEPMRGGAPSADAEAETAIQWPDPLDDAQWPSPYRAFTDNCQESLPRLPRRTVMSVAPLVAGWFLSDSQRFGREYYALASLFQNGDKQINEFEPYRELLRRQLRAPRAGNDRSKLFDAVNEHDLANIHRAVWLLLYRGLTCLIDINPHGDWGDPPAGGTSQGFEGYVRNRSFHTNPNAYGSFAISTLDIPPPDLGIGEASPAASDQPIDGDPLPSARVREIARALARGIVTPKDAEGFYGDDYLGVVKSFYRDRKNHTSVPADPQRSYLHVINDILQNTSTVAPAQRLTDADFANVHRGAWLFLAHRFYFLVGKKAFGDLDDPNLVLQKETGLDRRVFEVPNAHGAFTVDLGGIDPDDDP